ncbi:MAG: hypothetical protein INR71_10065 [Terriglobus roseus]|nr:hypothetical protein [Terriglobus roseus]
MRAALQSLPRSSVRASRRCRMCPRPPSSTTSSRR